MKKAKPYRPNKFVPFNGYVRDPWAIFIIWGIVALGLLYFAIEHTFTDYNILPEKYEHARVKFVTVEKNIWWADIFLESELGKSVIPLNGIEDVDGLLEKAETDEFYILYSLYEHSEEYPIAIWYLESSDGKVFATPEQIQKANFVSVAIGLWIVAILTVGSFIAMNYILWNAPKYYKIAKLFIRKEYRYF